MKSREIAQLLADLASDLDGAFPALIDAYGPMVLTLATRLTDMSSGPDITQDVMLRSYRALRDYEDERILALNLQPWLATITRNLVRNEYRRRERKGTVPLSTLTASATAGSPIDDPVSDGVESHDRLNGLLGNLSDAQREAVVLRHVVGLSVRDVALTMACPEGTAKSHISRGLSQLRAVLADDIEGAAND